MKNRGTAGSRGTSRNDKARGKTAGSTVKFNKDGSWSRGIQEMEVQGTPKSTGAASAPQRPPVRKPNNSGTLSKPPVVSSKKEQETVKTPVAETPVAETPIVETPASVKTLELNHVEEKPTRTEPLEELGLVEEPIASAKEETKVEVKEEPKEEPKVEVNMEVKEEPKVEAKAEAKEASSCDVAKYVSVQDFCAEYSIDLAWLSNWLEALPAHFVKAPLSFIMTREGAAWGCRGYLSFYDHNTFYFLLSDAEYTKCCAVCLKKSGTSKISTSEGRIDDKRFYINHHGKEYSLAVKFKDAPTYYTASKK